VTLMPYRRIFLHYGKNLYQFEAIDFDVFMTMRGSFSSMETWKGPLTAHAGRGVLISEVFANQTGLEVGERFQARILGFPLDMPVLGIFRDYRTQEESSIIPCPDSESSRATGHGAA